MQSHRAIIFYLILFSHFCYSGNGDSLKFSKTIPPKFFNSHQFEFSDSTTSLDNPLKGFQNYLSRNNIGNSGLAVNSLSYSALQNEIGFNYSKNNLLNYFYARNNLLFFDTHTPYTDLFYVIGSKKEQDFRMTFSYNIKKNWNVTANFFRIRSDGFYLRQSTNDNFISFSTVYKTENNRYNLLVGLFYNFAQNSENGGISNDSIFLNAKNLDKRLLDVNLISAKRSHLQRGFFINQYINFGKKNTDSLLAKSIVPSSHICLATSFEDNLMKYIDSDPASGFYSNIYFDTIQTYDSTYNLNFENELSWKRINNGKKRGLIDKFGFGLSLKHQLVMIKQRQIDSVYNNVIIGGSLYNMYSQNGIFYSVSGKYCLSGYNKDDYSITASIKKNLGDSLTSVVLEGASILQNPDFIFNHYSSNHFKWDNNFDKISENRINLVFLAKKYSLEIGLKYREIKNPTYFDNYAIGRQYLGSVPVFSSFLKKDFSFFNWHLDNTITYQYVPDSTVIRLPQFVLEHSLYYENYLFNKAMRIQIGASVFFVSEYFANTYMPATGQFYLQDDKKYGNYPFIDFFINARVKSARIFFKVDHLNYGWMGNEYQMTPRYPMNDRAFKLGISWRFYD